MVRSRGSLGVAMVLAASALAAQTRPAARVIYERQFDSHQGGECAIRVQERISKGAFPSQAVIVQCGGRQVVRYDLGEGEVRDIRLLGHDDDRIAVNWERGLAGPGLTIIQIAKTSPILLTGKILIEFQDKCGGEAVDDDFVMTHVGRRFIEAAILPQATKLYHWQDGEYVLQATYVWLDGMEWEDRYCILRSNLTGCPVKKLEAMP